MKASLLTVSLLLSLLGMAWLALAMQVHWQQVRGGETALRPGTVRALRLLGSGALLASLLICLVADHFTIALLVWVMALAASALVVAFALSRSPRRLAPLVAWVRSPRLDE